MTSDYVPPPGGDRPPGIHQPTFFMRLITTIWLLALLGCQSGSQQASDQQAAAGHAHHAPASEGTAKSPRQTAMANLGEVHVHIDYAAPSVRGRIIWGGLVAYDEVWVSGAHMATSISFMGDVSIEGEEIPAGKYAFFAIPGREAWTLILNRNWEQHLADDYDPAEDVLRWQVQPDTIDLVESLAYRVQPADSTVALQWERLQLRFKVMPIPSHNHLL